MVIGSVRAGDGEPGADSLLFPAEQRDCFVCCQCAAAAITGAIRSLGVTSTMAAKQGRGLEAPALLIKLGHGASGPEQKGYSDAKHPHRSPLGSARARDRRSRRRKVTEDGDLLLLLPTTTRRRRSPSGRATRARSTRPSTTSAIPARSRSEPRSGGGRWSVRAAPQALSPIAKSAKAAPQAPLHLVPSRWSGAVHSQAGACNRNAHEKVRCGGGECLASLRRNALGRRAIS